MSSESGEIMCSKPRATTETATKPTEPEQLPCPRCDSTNTKFCYYNNYNLSQPRHFCKSCRRYWTRGGALRNVPIGGGTRRSSSSSNKRPRTTSPPSSSLLNQEVLNSVPLSDMGNGSVSSSHFMGHCYDMNLNEALPETGTFSSLLTSNTNSGNVFFGVPSHHRYVGVGSGLYGMGFGLNMFDFPVEQREAAVVAGGGGGVSGGGATWQLEGGLNEGSDNFSWPDLAISTPGKSSLK